MIGPFSAPLLCSSLGCMSDGGRRAFWCELQVPLSVGITWAVAFLLTEVGAYSYKGCDADVPSSNAVSEYCRGHVPRMKHCRADTSHALRSSPWFRLPYPMQWGTPIFDWKMVLIMCVASVIASVDSVSSCCRSSSSSQISHCGGGGRLAISSSLLSSFFVSFLLVYVDRWLCCRLDLTMRRLCWWRRGLRPLASSAEGSVWKASPACWRVSGAPERGRRPSPRTSTP